mmetsp:Transcript_18536/g.28464  ORF Transcript_18536/g.28464 Transcript_18536/m.28464 type:complete len:214 (-) Transcript_18536:333-974(-)|eukprot:CAMPEP_0170482900 /NCGR_PEP_ID=MMETSP0208-20121228/2714_1 /TAXON_ID=197538 /ORGANISM="Strombidium inclinatum, Strain S3" /LENGTH=213 /DNA_ID=CAMNT_0010755785 /DNA_START=363 /DNA_END=1004 /DNA_ORIENTATION=-
MQVYKRVILRIRHYLVKKFVTFRNNQRMFGTNEPTPPRFLQALLPLDLVDFTISTFSLKVIKQLCKKPATQEYDVQAKILSKFMKALAFKIGCFVSPFDLEATLDNQAPVPLDTHDCSIEDILKSKDLATRGALFDVVFENPSFVSSNKRQEKLQTLLSNDTLVWYSDHLEGKELRQYVSSDFFGVLAPIQDSPNTKKRAILEPYVKTVAFTS